jgi:integrase
MRIGSKSRCSRHKAARYERQGQKTSQESWAPAAKFERQSYHALVRQSAPVCPGRFGPGLTANRIDPDDLARLVKRATAAADIDGTFAGHSLRAGFITIAASTKGVSEADIQRVSGHRSVVILRGYVRQRLRGCAALSHPRVAFDLAKDWVEFSA